MTPGERLALFIDVSGLNLKQFAADRAMPYRTLQDYVAGKSNIGSAHLIKLAQYGIDLNWLLTGQISLDFSKAIETYGIDNKAIGIIVSDRKIQRQLTAKSFEMTDELHQKYFEKNGRMLNMQGLVNVASGYYKLFLNEIARKADMVNDLWRAGHSTSDIIEKLIISDRRNDLHHFIANRMGCDIGQHED